MVILSASRLVGVPARRPVSVRLLAARGSKLLARSGSDTVFENSEAYGKVNFQVVRHVDFGQSVSLVGDPPELGTWDIASGVKLDWEEGDVWSCETELPSGEVEYKYVVGNSDGELVEWYPGDNLTTVVAPNETIEVSDEWTEDILVESDASLEVVTETDDTPAAEAPELVSGGEQKIEKIETDTDGALPEAQTTETSIMDSEESSEPNGNVPEASAGNGTTGMSNSDEEETVSKSDGDKQVELMS